MHPTQTHAQFHHPGLLRGADFCDAGVECAPEVEIKLPEKTWHLFPFEEKVEGDESETPIIGWRHRALTGNDACADLLDVSQHRHQGHSSAVKIRPTYCLHTATATAHGGHPEASKIGPLSRETASHPATAKPTHDHHHDEYWGTHPVTTDRATRTLRNSSLLRETPAAPTQISIRYLERSSDESQQHPLSEEDEPESTEPPRNPRPRQSSLSGKFCFGRTTSWFRGLLNLPEMHRTRLTDGPRKISANDSSGADQADDRREAARPRTLSGVSTGSIDAKFKRTFSNLERLLSEALALANEVVEQEDQRSHGLLVDAQRGRLQRQRSGHRLKEERSLPESHRHYVHGSKAMPTASLPKAAKERVARKSKSCHVPLNEHRGSHQSHDTRDGASDYQPKAKEAESRNRPAIASEGRSKSFGLDGVSDDEADWTTQYNLEPAVAADESPRQRHRTPSPVPGQEGSGLSRGNHGSVRVSLRGRTHVSLRGSQGFSLARGYRRQPVARDWPTGRKRFVATVACLSTALIGMLIGIYAGLVPSIQYYIADLYHYAIQGNVWFYAGLAVPTFFFWPLPLLHGRKPYILSSLILAMGLLFPQAIAVSAYRPPSLNTWRWALIGSRAFMGLVLGFASMNFHSILTDLFGASLMSRNPHQEVVDEYDVRRHGGGMGVWLGIWTWCFTGSLGVGFLIGAVIIDKLSPVWGFYVSIIMIAVVLLLNVVCPETRRSMYRRSVCEVKTGDHISRRVARGEVMMHRVKDGPKWWGEEVYHGVLLSLEMLRQPGFLVIAVYTGWIYANVVLAIVLLGSLTSQVYRFHSPIVGLCVSFISIGALVAVPFQKANLFSRGRSYQQTSADTFDNRITWTSHLLRRGIFCAFLPLVGIAYTIASGGTDIPVEVPTLFAAIIGYLSGLAISECNGFIMETFDTSDLQPGMTGRPRRNSGNHPKRTNYSSFPRVTAAFAICHALGFLFAACATFVGGVAQRHLGQQAATGTMAGIMLILTLLLLVILVRFKDVQIIPNSKSMEMDKWTEIRRQSIRRRSTAPKPGTSNTQNTMTDEEMWRPIIIGNPSSKIRRMNILELGSMTRWTEIRKKNKLIDERMAHLNRAALAHAAEAVEEATGIGAMATELVRRVSSRSKNRNARRFHGGKPWPGTEDSSSQTTTQGTNFPDHWHGPGQALSEHVCVMGETVIEADEPRRSNDIGSEPWHETPEITITRPGDTPEPPR
ncbi:major facilitator superfamily domain-containing protein [Diplogelasinospora grovesii]|uniref:Major facilitator superfamily domain-containing protein n=1 Tax=Diplogelasinospora grovesii TaxID=303347 RepID=A0AAN6SAL0_9PEZI|nr:major facilitator superfamily domain-containing protein [Diplogelasinospora grovesii]